MSDPICDFSYPLKDTLPLDVPKPKPQSGIIVRWGDREEFFPDQKEDECLTDAQGAAL